MALKAGLGEDGLALFDRWSQTAEFYDAQAVRAVWKSIKSGDIRFATLFYEAQQRGFDRRLSHPVVPTRHRVEQERLKQAEQVKVNAEHRTAAKLATELWTQAVPAPDTHPYLTRKGVRAYGLRCYRGRLAIGDMACHDALIVPARNADGALTTLQFINAEGTKRFLSGGQKSGSFYLIGEPTHVLCLAEGYATAASIHQATGYPVAVAFDTGNLCAVAIVLNETFPSTPLVICADDDGQTQGNPGLNKAAAARQVGARVAVPRSQA